MSYLWILSALPYHHRDGFLAGKNDSLLVAFPAWDNPQPRPGYIPRSIPKDISERLMRLHGDPFAWWLGQFFKYTMRKNEAFEEYVANLTQEIGYKSPIVRWALASIPQ